MDCFLPGTRRADFRSTVLLFLFVGYWWLYIATIRPNCDSCLSDSKNWPIVWAQLLPKHTDTADLYFKQTVACLCGYRNSSPHKDGVVWMMHIPDDVSSIFWRTGRALRLRQGPQSCCTKEAAWLDASHAPTTTKTQLTGIQAAAGMLHLKLGVLEVRSRADLEAAFPSASRRAAGAVLMLSSPLIGANTNLLAELSLTQKLPAITLFSDFARNGLRAKSSSPIPSSAGDGSKDSEWDQTRRPPNWITDTVWICLEPQIAGQLGLTVPPLVLLRADEVIE
jgi:hypothetical protein